LTFAYFARQINKGMLQNNYSVNPYRIFVPFMFKPHGGEPENPVNNK
tara:strand:+ start:425 stop:565 length:141 start_codon:yes stop_codon:yes gene_type:complete